MGSADVEYKKLVECILAKGSRRTTRNGDVLSLFAPDPLKIKVSCDAFPIITTKATHFKSITEELLWFLKGSTDVGELQQTGVKIWDANAPPERHGDLGPIYGFQWRHFGATYGTSGDNYDGQGVDQIQALITSLKNDPYSRRHIVCSWNPCDLVKMALPPCHVLSQWYITNEGDVDCQLYQRSGDVGLGIPFNISSYALLMCLISHVIGRRPGTLTHVLGDAHIYLEHIEALEDQIQRPPIPLPKLELNPKIDNIFGFTSEDIKLSQYMHHPKVVMTMKV